MTFRMPAEFEPQATVWVDPPHNAETWPGPGCFTAAVAQFDDLCRHIARFTPVSTTRELNMRTNDSWIRDYGPVFVVETPASGDGECSTTPRTAHSLVCHDFTFDNWGRKYPGWERDNETPQRIAHALGIDRHEHAFVLEGGSIDTNGQGEVLTTRSCLLNAGRNPGVSRDDIERLFARTLGARHVIWLPGGIAGDDTNGHIDDAARFITPDTVAAVRAPRGHPDFDMLDRNWRALQAASGQISAPLRLIGLPHPAPMHYDYPTVSYEPAGRRALPASYANFLITNGGVIVPTFGQPSDDVAMRTLDDAMPRHTIVPVRCEHLVVGLGAVHCLTLNQPAV